MALMGQDHGLPLSERQVVVYCGSQMRYGSVELPQVSDATPSACCTEPRQVAPTAPPGERRRTAQATCTPRRTVGIAEVTGDFHQARLKLKLVGAGRRFDEDVGERRVETVGVGVAFEEWFQGSEYRQAQGVCE
jgi:hypothetical protein